MTEENIKIELFNAACDGNEAKFKELAKMLEQVNENSVFANTCADMLKNHPNIRHKKI